jgi:hypothetical protein
MQISAATIRAWGEKAPKVRLPPKDPVAWRANLTGVRLTDVLRDLWGRGIPVIHVENLPSPSFQGLAWIARDRPVIVLGHALDEPARLAFIIAHEVAHIVNGDCSVDVPVVDEEEEVSDDHEMEKRADAYAIGLLTGGAPIPILNASDFKDLATKAAKIEKDHRVDAAAVIWSWARRTGDYALATMAARALYRTKGGGRALRAALDENVDVEAASETDRALLRCVAGDPTPDAATA